MKRYVFFALMAATLTLPVTSAVAASKLSTISCSIVEKMPDYQEGKIDITNGERLPPTANDPVIVGAEKNLGSVSDNLIYNGSPTQLMLMTKAAAFRIVYLGSPWRGGGQGYAEALSNSDSSLIEGQLLDWSKSSDGLTVTATFTNVGRAFVHYNLTCSLK